MACQCVSHHADESNGRLAVIGEVEWPAPVTRIAQFFAPVQEGLLHFIVAKRLGADQAVLAHVLPALIRRHQADWVWLPNARRCVDGCGDDRSLSGPRAALTT